MERDARQQDPGGDQREPISVTQLTTRIKQTLETAFPSIWVVGEISDVARPRSGHVYLTLKDEQSQIRAVIWRSTASRLKTELADGQQVVCRGDLDVYLPRGSYQLVIRQLEPLGVGSLQQRLRQLQQKLAAEGLFAPEHKQPLPPFPRRVAVVTSPTGAAIRDFLEVVRNRWRGVDVLILPVRVQGARAAGEIAQAIRLVPQLRPACDVLVVTRGGGSMEDLWCFNEEVVVRAIFDSPIPVVSAVGHEIDVTLADLVADVRALTPTEAAQTVVPSADEVAASLRHFHARLDAALESVAKRAATRLEALAHHRVFRRPLEHIQQWELRLDDWHARATRAVRGAWSTARDRVQADANHLESLSPLSVLARGYSVTQRPDDGTVVRRAETLQVGEQLLTRFAAGTSISRVESIEAPQEDAQP